MEDYKELLEDLKWKQGSTFGLCDDAYKAIETLFAERDAAIEMLHGECHACKNNAGWHNIGKCATCKYENANAFLPEDSERHSDDNWEWSGPDGEK